jgi:hypothetical protein
MTSQGYEETPEAAGWQAYDDAPAATGWIGWSIFAATMMIIGGGLNTLYGLVVVVNDDWVVWTNRNAAQLDLTTWGWVHIVVGVLVVLAGFGVLNGNVLGPDCLGDPGRRAQHRRQLPVRPRLPLVVDHRDHHRCPRHLGPHRPRP